jgi:uncharacterized damage-inducible protein DinB
MSSFLQLQMLTRYKAWANDLLFQALSELPESELVAERQIIFGNILRTLNHVYVMDVVWKTHLEGGAHGFSTRIPATSPPFAELRDAQKNIDTWFVRYAQGLVESASGEIVNFTFIGGGAGSMSRCDILLHVVNHTTYHRGHIAGMIYQIPAHPPTTDLPVFLRDSACALLP